MVFLTEQFRIQIPYPNYLIIKGENVCNATQWEDVREWHYIRSKPIYDYVKYDHGKGLIAWLHV